jgi:NCAIR mutase (PurE)-related protein
MSERPFDAVRRALHDISQKPPSEATPPQQLDPDRQARTGIPEFIFAKSKRPEDVIAGLRTLAGANGRALATGCPAATIAAIQDALDADHDITIDVEANAVVVALPGQPPVPRTGGRIAVITAGSSDGSVAAEAALVARELGVEVFQVRDIGVAGLHRLVGPLEQVISWGVAAIVVAAGMDGALPSVVAGLVAVPVIGVPTSTGYGYGGEGVGALMTMLQSCSPGLTVVNIDNGVGAGAAAALIANRVAAARGR